METLITALLLIILIPSLIKLFIINPRKNKIYRLNINLYTSINANCDIIRKNCNTLKALQNTTKTKELAREILVVLDYITIDKEKHSKEIDKL